MSTTRKPSRPAPRQPSAPPPSAARAASAHVVDAHVADAHVVDAHVADAHVVDANVAGAHVEARPACGLAGEGNGSGEAEPFWRRKPLDEMTKAEWESLCDGCGRCCLIKLEDEDTGRTYYTDVGCTLLDTQSCACRDYPHRQRQVPDCLKLTPETVRRLSWLPPTCAYRLVREGRDLYWWHPLVSGERDTVHLARVSVRGRVSASEDDMLPDDLIDRIVRWPERVPRAAARRAAPDEGARKGPRRVPVPERERN